MTAFEPSAAVADGVLRLQLLDAQLVRSVDVRCVVDLTDFGGAVGVEVLDLRRQLAGGDVDPRRSNGEISWSYDDEIDAFYVHVADGRGQVQRSAVATAWLDSAERVARIDVPLPSVE